jgi:hypothetical protein
VELSRHEGGTTRQPLAGPPALAGRAERKVRGTRPSVRAGRPWPFADSSMAICRSRGRRPLAALLDAPPCVSGGTASASPTLQLVSFNEPYPPPLPMAAGRGRRRRERASVVAGLPALGATFSPGGPNRARTASNRPAAPHGRTPPWAKGLLLHLLPCLRQHADPLAAADGRLSPGAPRKEPPLFSGADVRT